MIVRERPSRVDGDHLRQRVSLLRSRNAEAPSSLFARCRVDLGDVKTIGLTSDYHRESDDLLNEMEHGSRAIHNSVQQTHVPRDNVGTRPS